MKNKISILAMILLLPTVAYSQIGIQTPNPQGVFHVDGAKDNPATGVPSAAQQTNDVVITQTGNFGIGVTTPTNKLDVAGDLRVRTINPVGAYTTIDPVYADKNGVLVKVSSSIGQTLTGYSVILAPGGFGNVMDTLIDGAMYKAQISVSDGCADAAVGEFYVNARTFNNFKSVTGLGGLVGSAAAPVFTQINRYTVQVKWPNKVGCQDGTASTGFDYTLSMGNGTNLIVTNNGNTSKEYRVILNRIN